MTELSLFYRGSRDSWSLSCQSVFSPLSRSGWCRSRERRGSSRWTGGVSGRAFPRGCSYHDRFGGNRNRSCQCSTPAGKGRGERECRIILQWKLIKKVTHRLISSGYNTERDGYCQAILEVLYTYTCSIATCRNHPGQVDKALCYLCVCACSNVTIFTFLNASTAKSQGPFPPADSSIHVCIDSSWTVPEHHKSFVQFTFPNALMIRSRYYTL